MPARTTISCWLFSAKSAKAAATGVTADITELIAGSRAEPMLIDIAVTVFLASCS